ncbi:hypothetical protein [Micromonospora aurantiaca (nom. illeg.)]|uniref:hypothetical protein n=1 Tax=Micromonospora aurantiaca (nom. illeg.) TaxID=47850 RepID=UPI00165743A3|nr:hypothetical protein [Micromonospora aurantiaca]MBC9006118.1 hypothetical protein [Micromonospora aurantiaca]
MPDLIVYSGWRAVPPGLFTKSQLADLDLPRVPGGPPRAWVETSNWRGKKESYRLYSLRESLPSPASAAALEAARERATGGRVCDGCGARPDRPPVEFGSGGHLWCRACALVERLASRHRETAAQRAEAVRWAREMLAAQAVVVRVDLLLRPPAPSGRQDPNPVALRVDAVHSRGKRLVDATIRLVGPRVKAVPDEAVTPDAAAKRMEAVLSAPAVVSWSDTGVYALGQLYGGWRTGTQRPVMNWIAAAWRGDVDPDTLQIRSAIDPGTAGRTALLLRRMAATELPPPESCQP